MAPRLTTVTRYNTHDEYSVDFFGSDLFVTVTATPSVIRRWIRTAVFLHRRSHYNQPLVVGVGVQWTPAGYYSGRYYAESPAETLQLCLGKRCIIIQLSHCERVPRILRRFLVDPKITLVGVWNGQDARKLEQSSHGLGIGELVDIRQYVVDSEGFSLSRCSFEVVVEVCMGYRGVRLDPAISMTDWGVCDLSHGQILQASIKAYVCCMLGVWESLGEV
ncbi:hypothetical protein EUTSA_v10021493mg [Eutrema salsugineum]|uniref:3'-5' exonuclease domain-containing protein n=1 Tax=Eutrema salsugineum TaxID=72664 RepID=V4LE82_EUTSA|nr:uncharacterized protein LOC18025261 [Eutrema salsugineum]ESQ48785.1 hypothetical protein EUTSA_v10021493mg [Eutrema salsugineum]